VNFFAITRCVAVAYFFIDSVRKLLDTHPRSLKPSFGEYIQAPSCSDVRGSVIFIAVNKLDTSLH
jgi:hypothetical protein